MPLGPPQIPHELAWDRTWAVDLKEMNTLLIGAYERNFMWEV